MRTVLATLFAIMIGWVGMFGFVHGSSELLARESEALIYQSALSVSASESQSGSSGSESNRYYISEYAPAPPELSARAYLVADLISGDILLEHNIDASYPIASVSKLTTATVALDERMASTSLLYPLLLESSNETAEVIAKSFGRAQFMKFMNDFVASLGMAHTHYRDPSGLSPSNVSSASDLLLLTRHIYQNHGDILAITRLSSKEENQFDNYNVKVWQNNNLFVQEHNPDYLGGKSGFTPEAGGTLVSLFDLELTNHQTRPMVIILLGTDNEKGVKYELAQKLIDYLKKYVYYK